MNLNVELCAGDLIRNGFVELNLNSQPASYLFIVLGVLYSSE